MHDWRTACKYLAPLVCTVALSTRHIVGLTERPVSFPHTEKCPPAHTPPRRPGVYQPVPLGSVVRRRQAVVFVAPARTGDDSFEPGSQFLIERQERGVVGVGAG
jgi:hypothetical protein